MSLADQPNQSIVAGRRLMIERWRAEGTVVVAARPEVPGSLEESSPAILQLVEEHLPTHGAVLLRGFHGADSNGFHSFARALSGDLLA